MLLNGESIMASLDSNIVNFKKWFYDCTLGYLDYNKIYKNGLRMFQN